MGIRIPFLEASGQEPFRAILQSGFIKKKVVIWFKIASERKVHTFFFIFRMADMAKNGFSKEESKIHAFRKRGRCIQP